MNGSTPRASVIVPTYRRRDSVLRLLGALRDQTVAPDAFEVIVSIDGSEDGTREAVASFEAPHRIEVVWEPNRGRAGACNAGIRRARGELLIVLDDDMEPTPAFVEAHLRAHERAERIGVLGAVPIRTDATTPPVVRFVAAKFNEHLDRLEAGDEIRFRSFYSGNFSIRRALIEEVGLYDESFRIYGNEDTELSLRLVRAGVELRYDPRALARQNYEKDFAALAKDNYAKGRTTILAAMKHPDEFGPFSLDAFRAGTGKWVRSGKWMRARAALIAIAPLLPVIPRALVRLIEVIERFEPSRLPTYYGFVVDYFFWSGVRAALKESEAGEPGALPRPSREPAR